MDDLVLQDFAMQPGTALSRQELMLVTAESCTGGWLGQAITSIAGSSGWFDRAVSEQTAYEMAAGAVARSHALVAVSITGIAGPDGGTAQKPVGMICFAWVMKDGMALTETRYYSGSREEIRRQSVAGALQGLIDLLYSVPPRIA